MKPNVKKLLMEMAKGDPELYLVITDVYNRMKRGKQLEFLGNARRLKDSLNKQEYQHESLSEEELRKGLTEFANEYHTAGQTAGPNEGE